HPGRLSGARLRRARARAQRQRLEQLHQRLQLQLPDGGAVRALSAYLFRRPKPGASNMAGKAPTNESDSTYDLISVMYHALQGCETLGQYCEDARQAGDQELVDCFEKAIEENQEIAARCKKLLASRLQGEAGERSSAPQGEQP